MDVYENLLEALKNEYDLLPRKESARGAVSVARHRKSGTRYLYRHFCGSGAVYRTLLGVCCPYLPQIYEVGEHDGRTAVLEEYVQGDTLDALLAGCLLTPAEARRIARQLCAALWTLHSLGIVHRDVKPDNVIIRGRDAVLLDFDASRFYRRAQQADTQILGTTGYAAPEQYGLAQTDGRADIYALGVLLNVMLTGRHPSETLASGRMGRIVQRCTMVNPRKRFQTVLHLMEAL